MDNNPMKPGSKHMRKPSRLSHYPISTKKGVSARKDPSKE